MWQTKFLFRSEKCEKEMYCNPMHIRQAAACALAEQEAEFMEVADANTGKTLMVAVYRTANPNGFMFLFPEDEESEQ
jgi:hypothetical protein